MSQLVMGVSTGGHGWRRWGSKRNSSGSRSAWPMASLYMNPQALEYDSSPSRASNVSETADRGSLRTSNRLPSTLLHGPTAQPNSHSADLVTQLDCRGQRANGFVFRLRSAAVPLHTTRGTQAGPGHTGTANRHTLLAWRHQVTGMPSEVPASEFRARLRAVRDRLTDMAADAAVWFGATSIEYLTGFHHIQTERPVALAVTAERVEVTVPRLEVERVTPNSRIDAVHSYFDYPMGEPVETVAEMLDGLGADSVLADADGAPGVMGYDGPPLSEFVELDEQEWVPGMREAKSDAEVALVRESARWANLAHRYLADNTEVGAHPVTVSQRASMEGSRAMLDALGSEYAVRTRGGGPVHAGYISGAETALPHGHTPNERLSRGDVLITGATANVDGYFSELERTMFVGDVTDEQEDYFDLMLAAQETAFEAMGPGVPVSHVDEAVWAYFEEQGVTDLARHHVGHNIGLDGHEPPYIDRGNDVEMEPGHIYTIEPGLYTDEAGYRHSDTVVVTEDGIELLTYYPRDLASNIVGVE
jgi:Xaa-Pro dipeptidase